MRLTASSTRIADAGGREMSEPLLVIQLEIGTRGLGQRRERLDDLQTRAGLRGQDAERRCEFECATAARESR